MGLTFGSVLKCSNKQGDYILVFLNIFVSNQLIISDALFYFIYDTDTLIPI